MSNIKISELESTQKIDNEDLLMVVQENKNKKIKFSDFFPKTTIELLTVSATAPTECNIGDKYYNTTTSKIYTSTAENIWGTEEENPTSLYLYVDLEHKELYYFNGIAFVSYGGGSGGAGGDTLPTGAILPFSSDTIPNGWLLCDGSSFSATSYPELFDVIGVTYGWDDDRNPKLPDLRGRVAVGKKDATSADDTEFSSLGNTGGGTAKDKIKIAGTYFGFVDTKTVSGTGYAGQGLVSATKNTSESAQSLKDNGIDLMPPYIVTNYIIKAKNTAIIKGEVIQETGTASETNVYSASAVDNKIKTNIVTGQEVATNEYIDGDRVYVKKINFTFNSDLSNWQLIDTISNFNKLVKIYGSVVASETETSNILSYYNNEGSTSYVNPQAGEVRIKHNYSYVNNKPATVTIYYTKNS